MGNTTSSSSSEEELEGTDVKIIGKPKKTDKELAQKLDKLREKLRSMKEIEEKIVQKPSEPAKKIHSTKEIDKKIAQEPGKPANKIHSAKKIDQKIAQEPGKPANEIHSTKGIDKKIAQEPGKPANKIHSAKEIDKKIAQEPRKPAKKVRSTTEIDKKIAQDPGEPANKICSILKKPDENGKVIKRSEEITKKARISNEFCKKRTREPEEIDTNTAMQPGETQKKVRKIEPIAKKLQLMRLEEKVNKTAPKRIIRKVLPNKSSSHQVSPYTEPFCSKLMNYFYHIDIALLCTIRKSLDERFIPLTITLGDPEIDKFSSIVLYHEKRFIYLQIMHIDKYDPINNSIDYAGLFDIKQILPINDYFNSFVSSAVSHSNDFVDSIEYLVVYTNAKLDRVDYTKLIPTGPRFKKIDINSCGILKDLLYIEEFEGRLRFYQLSKDETREELLKKLEFSSVNVQTMMEGRKNSPMYQKEIKEKFLDKFILAVNQLNREELTSTLKEEVGKVHCGYMELHERMIFNLANCNKKIEPDMMYEFNLLLSLLHDMFLRKKFPSVNCMSNGLLDLVMIMYKKKITYISTFEVTDKKIGYSHFFPAFKPREKKQRFSLNNNFATYLKQLEKNENLKFIVLFTNADLDLTKENMLKEDRTRKKSYPFQFDTIDVEHKKYKVLQYCSFINKNDLYKLAVEDLTMLVELLIFPVSLQNGKGKPNPMSEREMKEKFLKKLVFAVKQPNTHELNMNIRLNLLKPDVPYDYAQLQEIALRWVECRRKEPVTEILISSFLDDIKNNESSYP